MHFLPVIRATRQFSDAALVSEYGVGALLVVTCEVLHHHPGGQDPHFSVTCEVSTNASRRKRDIEAGGCMHELAEKYWPECAAVVRMHLSSALDGSPMYAEANGFYFLAGMFSDGLGKRFHAGNGAPSRCTLECAKLFADHMRLSLDEAHDASKRIVGHVTGAEDGMHAECERMAPRWKRDRDVALAWLWENASPSDQRGEWAFRCAKYLGHDVNAHLVGGVK